MTLLYVPVADTGAVVWDADFSTDLYCERPTPVTTCTPINAVGPNSITDTYGVVYGDCLDIEPYLGITSRFCVVGWRWWSVC